jgi:hypothetical protein
MTELAFASCVSCFQLFEFSNLSRVDIVYMAMLFLVSSYPSYPNKWLLAQFADANRQKRIRIMLCTPSSQ